jgi:O-antigen/teichoic acid export membrane protein
LKLFNVVNKYIKELKQSEFIKNASTLMTGSVISQVIPLLSAPIISRLYYPEDYALVAAYSSITVLLTVVATGMYSSALMIDKTDDEAFNTGLAAFIVTVAITVVSLIIFLIFTESIAALTGNENITFWLYFIPLTVFFAGGYQTLNMWNNRKRRYKRLAGNRIMQTIVTTGTALLFGFLSYHSTGLLLSLLLGQAFAFSLLFIQTLQNDIFFLKTVNITKIKSSFILHKDFPKYNMPQGFLDGFRESSIILIISNFFGAAVLGSYSFAMSILNKPLQLIGESIRQVFFQKVSSIYNEKKNLWFFTKKTLLSLFAISVPIFLIIGFFGKEIFVFLFSEKWVQAGIFSQILSFWLMIKLIISPVTSIPLIAKKQKYFFLFGLAYNLSLPLMLLFCAVSNFNILFTFIIFIITGFLNLAAQLFWFRKLTMEIYD